MTDVVDPAPLLALLGGRRAYYRFVHEGITEGHNVEYYDVAEQRILGAEGFAKRLRARLTKEQLHRGRPSSLDQAVRDLAGRAAVDPELLRSPDRSREVSRLRTLLAYTLVRRLGFPLSAVAAYMKRDAATISSLISRVAEQLQDKRRIRRTVERLTKIV
jgi:chromosomal replication initiation ATPase DnaA